MRIEQLLCFQQVVQCRSFTKAAGALYTTQPSVSKMIDALEEELGKQLFLRTSRGIELTAFGSVVYQDVRVILNLVEGWRSDSVGETSVQDVHIQSTSTMCNFLSGDFLAQMQERYPNINILLHDCRRTEIIHQMLESDISVGLIPIREENQADTAATMAQIQKNGWESCPVIDDEKRVFVSARNPLASRKAVYADDLAELPLGTYSNVNDDNWTLFSKYFKNVGTYRRHNKQSIFQFVAEDKCAAIFPYFTSQYEYLVQKKEIVPIHIQDLDLGSASFQLVYRPGKALLEEEHIVVQELKQYFKGLRR